MRQDIADAEAQKKKKLSADLAYLSDNRLPLLKAGVYTPEAYVVEETRLNRELLALSQHKNTASPDHQELAQSLLSVSELLKNVAVAYSNSKSHEKDGIVRTIFSELTLSENTFDYQCTKGFKPFSDRFVPGSDLTVWLSELMHHAHEIQESITLIKELLSKEPDELGI